MLKRTYQFLKDNPIFYLATLEGDVPRVRPFGLVVEHNDRLYFGTANTKDVYRQLQANPRIEISTTSSEHKWIRLNGKAVLDNNIDVKRKAFEDLPMLANIYQTYDNPTFVVFYIADAEVTFYSMTGETENGKF